MCLCARAVCATKHKISSPTRLHWHESDHHSGVAVAEPTDPPKSFTRRFGRWLLKAQAVEPKGRAVKEGQPEQHSWWQVVCLTGVDYFSTLGYIPAIAGLAAGG